MCSSDLHADVPIPGSDWTVRDATAHLVSVAGLYCELANGLPSPVHVAGAPAGYDGARYREAQAAYSAQRLADIPEGDPDKLARLLLVETGRLVDTVVGRPGDQPVSYHCGVPMTVAGITCVYLGEQMIHGYDMATAVGVPWPLDPGHAALVLYGYGPCFAMAVNRQTTRGLDAAFEIELRGVDRLVVRFTDGEYGLEPAGSAPVDCTISADPVGYLMVATGRLSLWSAIALGLISAGGPRPELALSFKDLFIFP